MEITQLQNEIKGLKQEIEKIIVSSKIIISQQDELLETLKKEGITDLATTIAQLEFQLTEKEQGLEIIKKELENDNLR